MNSITVLEEQDRGEICFALINRIYKLDEVWYNKKSTTSVAR